MSERRAPVSPEMSHTIRVARVLCIFLMMYTHVRPYPEFEHFPKLAPNIVLHVIYAVPSLLLGKASVPLLGAVSGWLFVHGWRGGWIANARRKARTVLLPLLLWNGILLALLWAVPDFETKWVRPHDLIGWLDKIVPLVEYPTNSPLYFLRDLFLCMLAAPLMLAAFDRWGRRGMAAVLGVAILYACVFGEYAVLTRPVILPTFIAGLILARTDAPVLSRRFFDNGLLAACALWAAIELCVVLPLTGVRLHWIPQVGTLPEVVSRFALAYLLWRAITWIAPTAAGKVIALLEPYIFFIFCSHHIAQLFAWYVFGPLIHNGAYSPVYPFYFFVQPVMAMLVGIFAYRALAEFAPRTLGLLTGGRIAPGLGQRRWALA